MARRFMLGIAIVCATASASLLAQTASQIQYTYDAAGNVIGIARVSKPDLTVSNLTIGTIRDTSTGAYNIPVTFQVNNVGIAAATGTWVDRGYLSTDGIFDDADEKLGGAKTRSTALAAGASYTVSTTFTTSTTRAPGNYQLFVKADGGAGSGTSAPTGPNVVNELLEGNNVQSAAIVLPARMPDLTVSNVSVGTISAAQDGKFSIPITFTVTNIGGATAAPNFYTLAYLSTDSTLNDTDENLAGYSLRNTALAPGEGYTATVTFTTLATTQSRAYKLFVKADGRGSALGVGTPTDSGYLAEGNEANNTQVVSFTLPARADLVVSAVSTGTITASQNGSFNIPITFTVTNSGGVPAVPNFYTLAYLSANATLDTSDENLTGYVLRSTPLAAGDFFTTTATFSTSTSTAPGNYSLFVKADGRGPALGIGTAVDNGYLTENNETNNAAKIAFTLPARADLTVTNASVGTITVAQSGAYNIPITFTVNNVGGVAAQGNFYTIAYLSSDATLDLSDQALGLYYGPYSTIAAGGSVTTTMTFPTIATTVPGNYTLFVKADGRGGPVTPGTNTDSGFLVEGNEANNTQALAVTLPTRPDLVLSNLALVSTSANGNGTKNVTVSFTVTNNGASAAQPNFNVTAYLSTNAILEDSDPYMYGDLGRGTALAPGASYTATQTYVTSSAVPAGTYTVFVKADGRHAGNGGTNTGPGYVVESDESNNVGSLTVTLP